MRLFFCLFFIFNIFILGGRNSESDINLDESKNLEKASLLSDESNFDFNDSDVDVNEEIDKMIYYYNSLILKCDEKEISYFEQIEDIINNLKLMKKDYNTYRDNNDYEQNEIDYLLESKSIIAYGFNSMENAAAHA